MQTSTTKLVYSEKYTFTILGRICFPSNGSSRHLDEDVSKNVKSQLEDLKEAAEGDAKPKREATSQSVEQAPIPESVVFLVFDDLFI